MAGRRGKKRNDPPKTPVHQPVPVTSHGGSAEVAHSSQMGRPIVANAGAEDEPFSDPESSLYDYQNMEDAGYSSVEMLSVSRKRRTGQLEHDIDEHQQAQIEEALESQRIHQNPEALYAMPIKKGARGQSSETLRTTLGVRNAMQNVQDLSSEDEMRVTDRGQRAGSKPQSARSLHFPVEHETAVKEYPLKSSASTPVSSRKSRNNFSEERIAHEIIEPVHVSRQQLNMAEEPVSARSRSAQMSARSVSLAEDRVRNLEAEREHLATLTSHLESEVQTYREVVSTYESGDQESARSLLTKKQVNDLKQENESLKNSIRRLNVELSAYQAKYRPPDNQADVQGMPSSGPPPSWLKYENDPDQDHPIILEFNIRYLNPLFLAYDDRIKEREEVIKKCQAELEALRLRTESLVKENEKLHAQVGSSSGGPIDNMEWEQMKDNARLVLEENQNLLEQISVKDQKTHDLHQAHVREVNKITKQMVLLKSEKEDAERLLEELRLSTRELKQKYDKLVLESQGIVTQEQHVKELADLKQKMAEAEDHHKQEVDSLNNKLQASLLERKTLGSQVIELTAENRRHQVETKLMHKNVKRAQQKMLMLQRAIETSENKEISVQDYLASVIKVAEKSAYERDTYEKVAKEHEIETKKAMKKLLQGNLTVGKMEEKLKLYKMKAAARISTVAERLREQEELFNCQKQEYEREINHLRNIIREKEDGLQELTVEKRDLEDQMEAVWQSANSENVRIREQMHKNVQQLRKHTGLNEALDAQEKLETVYLSSDDEHDKQDVP